VVVQCNVMQSIPRTILTASTFRHKIGKPGYLFTQIKPEKEQEWRDKYGGEAARKAKEEAAAIAAAKKASRKKPKDGKESAKEPEKKLTPEEEAAVKAAKKAAKLEKKAKGREGRPNVGKSVEAVEKDGANTEGAGTALEEVTEGVKNAVLQTS
jgi:methionyl-tRNA synthetase